MKNIAVVASGRGTNLQAIIDSIERGDLPAKLVVVVSDHEDAPALERARKHHIPAQYLEPGPKRTVLSPEAEQRFIEVLRSYGTELVCLAGYMRIIKKPFLEAFPGRILNIHPALLPAFPGLDVQRKALEYGVKYSGCTVHFVDESVDGGAIIAQAVVPVQDDDTPETLAARILEQEHRIYPEAIKLVLSGHYRIEGRRVIRT